MNQRTCMWRASASRAWPWLERTPSAQHKVLEHWKWLLWQQEEVQRTAENEENFLLNEQCEDQKKKVSVNLFNIENFGWTEAQEKLYLAGGTERKITGNRKGNEGNNNNNNNNNDINNNNSNNNNTKCQC